MGVSLNPRRSDDLAHHLVGAGVPDGPQIRTWIPSGGHTFLDAQKSMEKRRAKGGFRVSPFGNPFKRHKGPAGALVNPHGDSRVPAPQGNPTGARTPPWSAWNGIPKGKPPSKAVFPLVALWLLSGDPESNSLPQERNLPSWRNKINKARY